MPFKSKRQARWAFATSQPFAKSWAKKTKFSSLPEKKMRDGGPMSKMDQELELQSAMSNPFEIPSYTKALGKLKGSPNLKQAAKFGVRPPLATGEAEPSFDPITMATFLATAPATLPVKAVSRLGKVALGTADLVNPVAGMRSLKAAKPFISRSAARAIPETRVAETLHEVEEGLDFRRLVSDPQRYGRYMRETESLNAMLGHHIKAQWDDLQHGLSRVIRKKGDTGTIQSISIRGKHGEIAVNNAGDYFNMTAHNMNPLEAGRSFNELWDAIPKNSKVRVHDSFSTDSYPLLLKATQRDDVSWEFAGEIPLNTASKESSEWMAKRSAAGLSQTPTKEYMEQMANKMQKYLDKYNIDAKVKIDATEDLLAHMDDAAQMVEQSDSSLSIVDALNQIREARGGLGMRYMLKLPNIELKKLRQLLGPGATTASLWKLMQEEENIK